MLVTVLLSLLGAKTHYLVFQKGASLPPPVMCNCIRIRNYTLLDMMAYVCDDDEVETNNRCLTGNYKNGILCASEEELTIEAGEDELFADGDPVGQEAQNAIDVLDGRVDGRFETGGLNGNGTHFYVLDTGVACEHAAFKSARSCDGIFEYFNFSHPSGGNGNIPLDHCSDVAHWGARSHGSLVASIAVQVAPEVHIHSSMIMSCIGVSKADSLLQGIEAVLLHKQSLPPTVQAVAIAALAMANDDSVINHLWKQIESNGIVLVAAAGNQAQDASLVSPASLTEALTVGALVPISENSSLQLAHFSNYGPSVDVYAVGVTVEGATVEGTKNASRSVSGTSFSAPVVAGVTMQVVERYPTAPPDAVRAFMTCIAPQQRVLSGDGLSSDLLPIARGGVQIESASDACKQILIVEREEEDDVFGRIVAAVAGSVVVFGAIVACIVAYLVGRNN